MIILEDVGNTVIRSTRNSVTSYNNRKIKTPLTEPEITQTVNPSPCLSQLPNSLRTLKHPPPPSVQTTAKIQQIASTEFSRIISNTARLSKKVINHKMYVSAFATAFVCDFIFIVRITLRNST
jgi:hypothetical protein